MAQWKSNRLDVTEVIPTGGTTLTNAEEPIGDTDFVVSQFRNCGCLSKARNKNEFTGQNSSRYFAEFYYKL